VLTKSTLQPTPIFVGSLLSIESSYVVVNKTIYNCSSPGDAVEFALKSYFALNAKYPEESRQIWKLIQIHFCTLKDETDSKNTVNFSNILRKIA